MCRSPKGFSLLAACLAVLTGFPSHKAPSLVPTARPSVQRRYKWLHACPLLAHVGSLAGLAGAPCYLAWDSIPKNLWETHHWCMSSMKIFFWQPRIPGPSQCLPSSKILPIRLSRESACGLHPGMRRWWGREERDRHSRGGVSRIKKSTPSNHAPGRSGTQDSGSPKVLKLLYYLGRY